MRRVNMILLVLMGGGMALWSSRPSAECRDARARNAPDAAWICGQSGSSYGHSGGGYWGGRTWGGTGGTTSIASVVRGGFGSFHGFGGS
ncbi:MAG: hypothetical protein ABSC95_29800 [Acetobacteraceae bacterium]|jgi:hypothetical protein